MSGTRTYFLYSDEGLIAEYDAAGNELRSYGYRPDSTWSTDPLWLQENGNYYWYQNDHLGTPQKLVDSSGAVVWSATYSAFGEATISVETVTNNFRFPGQYFDVETGWHYNRFRYYEPGLGRYTRIDPIRFDGGNINLYTYTWNNPLVHIDVYGLKGKHTVKECHIDILAGHYRETPDLIKIPDSSGGTINCCYSNGGIDDMNSKEPEDDVELNSKVCDPEAFPYSQYEQNPFHERMEPLELIARTRGDIEAAKEFAKHLCKRQKKCSQIMIQVVCFGELADPPPTPTPFEGQPETKTPIYIGDANFLCREKHVVSCDTK